MALEICKTAAYLPDGAEVIARLLTAGAAALKKEQEK
jgi:hypothetical protein